MSDYQQFGVKPPYAGAPYPVPQTDGTAIAALVLAIVSFVVFPVIPAIVALVLAGNARRTIDASGGWKTGAGLVTAARIISWLNIGLAVLVIVVVVVFLIGISASGVSVPAVPLPGPVSVHAPFGN